MEKLSLNLHAKRSYKFLQRLTYKNEESITISMPNDIPFLETYTDLRPSGQGNEPGFCVAEWPNDKLNSFHLPTLVQIACSNTLKTSQIKYFR